MSQARMARNGGMASSAPCRCHSAGLDDPAEAAEIRQMIQRHADYTRSKRAGMILSSWAEFAPKFVKVMPNDYKRMLKSIKRVTDSGLSGEEALMAAFEENAKDVARVGGG